MRISMRISRGRLSLFAAALLLPLATLAHVEGSLRPLAGNAIVATSSSGGATVISGGTSATRDSSLLDFTVGQPMNIYFKITCNNGLDSYDLGDFGEPGDDSSEFFVYNPVSSGVWDTFSYNIPTNVTPGVYLFGVDGYSRGGACAGTSIELTGNVRIHPAVQGASNIWWLNGVGAVGGYPNTLTLSTPSGTPPYRWSISGPIQFIGAPGQSSIVTNSNSVQVSANGFSHSPGDAVVTVQTNDSPGLTGSAGFSVLTPYTSRSYTQKYPNGAEDVSFGNNQCHNPNVVQGTSGARTLAEFDGTASRLLADSGPTPNFVPYCSWGYVSRVHYQIFDQFGNILPSNPIPLNEYWSPATYVPDYSGTTWPAGKPGSSTLYPTDWYDILSASASPGFAIPQPQWPQTPLGNTPVFHVSGEWRAGSTSTGQGERIMTNTWQLYVDHGRHTNITTPAP